MRYQGILIESCVFVGYNESHMERTTFSARAKPHTSKIILGILFSILITFLSFHSKWNMPPQTAAKRSALSPNIVQNDSLSLITEPDQGTEPVISLISGAQKSIDLVMYQMTDKNISNALVAAQKRGVAVRVLLNKGYYGKQDNDTNTLAYTYLTQNGIPVHWTPAYFALTHQKTMIVDNTWALIMTWNFVPTYYATGRDFGILDTDVTDVNAIEQTFSADWDQNEITSSLGDDLIWSPGAEDDTLLLINNATSSLEIYNEEMNSDKVDDALKAAAKRGVRVQIMMTYATEDKLIFNDFLQNGIQIHTFSGKKNLYIHAKMIVADGTTAFIGSQNFSSTSLTKNRELGILLQNSDIISSLEQTFATDWQNAKEYQAK